MATIYSDNLVRARAGRNLNAHEAQGKLRILFYNFASLPAGAIGDVLVLGRMRSGERLVYGRETHAAAGIGTFNIGTYAISPLGDLGAAISAALYTSVALSAGVGTNFFGDLAVADVPVDPLATDAFLCITNVGTAFTTAARFTGKAFVVAD
ncbi:MAG: hypothetical protein ACRDHY_01435 [Anaerolineales bacterium]